MENLKEKSVYLLDLDGTIYLGDRLIDGAKEFLEKLRENDKKYFFITNNSSKSSREYVEKLKGLGIDSKENQIITSGQSATMYLKKHKINSRIYLLGNSSLEEEFIEEGFILEKDRNKEIDYVVVGMDTSLTYEKLWGACEYISQGVSYLATHLDSNCMLADNKFMPDAGAIAAFIKESTGRTPLVTGKPNKELVEGIALKYHIDKKSMIMVGDYLPTDIQIGKNAGIDSILVYSGETTEEAYRTSIIRADYVFNSVKDIIAYL